MNQTPNSVTAKILKMSKAGKSVKHFPSSKALCADLGLEQKKKGK